MIEPPKHIPFLVLPIRTSLHLGVADTPICIVESWLCDCRAVVLLSLDASAMAVSQSKSVQVKPGFH